MKRFVLLLVLLLAGCQNPLGPSPDPSGRLPNGTYVPIWHTDPSGNLVFGVIDPQFRH